MFFWISSVCVCAIALPMVCSNTHQVSMSYFLCCYAAMLMRENRQMIYECFFFLFFFAVRNRFMKWMNLCIFKLRNWWIGELEIEDIRMHKWIYFRFAHCRFITILCDDGARHRKRLSRRLRRPNVACTRHAALSHTQHTPHNDKYMLTIMAVKAGTYVLIGIHWLNYCRYFCFFFRRRLRFPPIKNKECGR